MKLKVVDFKNKETKTVALPKQFNESLRPDLVKRAVLALQANRRQKYGAKPDAGTRYSAYLSKRRHNYKGTYGIGQSRTPRKVLNRKGTRFYYVGAFAPQTALLKFRSLSFQRIRPPRGPRKVLCVVVVVTCACGIGEGCSPAATRPAMCAISTIK